MNCWLPFLVALHVKQDFHHIFLPLWRVDFHFPVKILEFYFQIDNIVCFYVFLLQQYFKLKKEQRNAHNLITRWNNNNLATVKLNCFDIFVFTLYSITSAIIIMYVSSTVILYSLIHVKIKSNIGIVNDLHVPQISRPIFARVNLILVFFEFLLLIARN